MSKKAKSKRAVIIRTGQFVTDGHQGGKIIAVSGPDVAIQWDDGRIEQRSFDSMSHLSRLDSATP